MSSKKKRQRADVACSECGFVPRFHPPALLIKDGLCFSCWLKKRFSAMRVDVT